MSNLNPILFRKPSLFKEEEKILREVLPHLTFPVSEELFDAWCAASIVVATEIAVIRGTGNTAEVFLTYREDSFYKGWHIPGSVVRPGENVHAALARVRSNELKLLSATLSFFNIFERAQGTSSGESPRGQELALLFITNDEGVTEDEHSRFFSLSSLPGSLIPEHIPVVEALRTENKVPFFS